MVFVYDFPYKIGFGFSAEVEQFMNDRTLICDTWHFCLS